MPPIDLVEVGSHMPFNLAREREFYRYLPPDYSAYAFAPFDHVSQTTFRPQPSRDHALNAFVQLGALKLGAERAMISLFGRTHQYILAEGTQTLSLSGSDSQDETDKLWLGCCILPKENSVCLDVSTIEPPTDQSTGNNPGTESSVLVVPDVREDERFQKRKLADSLSKVRFYAGVPMVSRRGITIGVFCVMDSQPRSAGIDGPGIALMQNMATTVMRQLEVLRGNYRGRQAERMIVGLGSFVEGKATLRDSWLEAKEQDAAAKVRGETAEGQLNRRQQDLQEERDSQGDGYHRKAKETTDQDVEEKGRSLPICSRHHKDPVPEGAAQGHSRGTPTAAGPLSESKKTQAPTTTNLYKSPSFRRSMSGDISQETLVTKTHRKIFSRAANLIRESIEVEGVVFLDAAVNTFGGLVDKSSCRAYDSSTRGTSSSSDDSTESSPPGSHKLGDQTGNMSHQAVCMTMGFSTSDASSIDDGAMIHSNFAVKESFLKATLHRYPNGKIFNYDENGSVSDDSSDGAPGRDKPGASGKPVGAEKPTKHKRSRSASLREDAQYLVQALPGARSIIFLGMWDSHKSRWTAAAVVWTNTPKRIFTYENELTFIEAFSNSIMAEIHRVDVEMAERAKTNLVSSISHELRSPLHGVLGTADILSDTALNALQHGMVHTIESCGRTLLDTINHLLDFTSIDKFKKTSYLAENRRHTRGKSSVESLSKEAQSSIGKNAPSYVQLDAVLEEVVESVFAGHSFYNHPHTHPLDRIPTKAEEVDLSSKPVTIIFDIQNGKDWGFLTYAGAWRRVLMNVFGNALKYTDKGYIYLGLKAGPITHPKRKKKREPEDSSGKLQVTLTVRDTGRGISEEYLQNGLFKAFSQEDSMAPGSGLGLSIVRQVIHSLGGSIDVSSTLNSGTTVTIRVPMAPVNAPQGSEESSQNETFSSTQETMRCKTTELVSFGPLPISEGDTTLQGSLKRLCEDWFHLDVIPIPLEAEHTNCDFYIMIQADSTNSDSDETPSPDLRKAFSDQAKLPSPLIVICSSPEAAHNLSVAATHRTETSVVEFISQPCGPRKLAKTLDLCIRREHGERPVERSPTRWVEVSNSSHLPLDIGPADAPADRMRIGKRPTTETMLTPMSELAVDPMSFAPTSGVEESSSPGPGGSPTIESSSPTDKPSAVLLVEDNHVNLQLLVAYAKKAGLEYMTAQNGKEALDTFQAHPGKFGAVVIDISMPVMNGFEASQHIRSFEQRHSGKTKRSKNPTIIVALTGLDSAAAQQEAYASGIDVFLTKPVKRQDLQEIWETIRR